MPGSTSSPTSRTCPRRCSARDDVVLLPHVGSATTQTREAMGRVVLDNVDAFLDRGELVTPGRLTDR